MEKFLLSYSAFLKNIFLTLLMNKRSITGRSWLQFLWLVYATARHTEEVVTLLLLLVDDILYTQDQRFLPIHDDGSNVWILKLTNPKVKDSGEYECQVSYHEDVEKKLTMPISLTVLGKEPKKVR